MDPIRESIVEAARPQIVIDGTVDPRLDLNNKLIIVGALVDYRAKCNDIVRRFRDDGDQWKSKANRCTKLIRILAEDARREYDKSS